MLYRILGLCFRLGASRLPNMRPGSLGIPAPSLTPIKANAQSGQHKQRGERRERNAARAAHTAHYRRSSMLLSAGVAFFVLHKARRHRRKRDVDLEPCLRGDNGPAVFVRQVALLIDAAVACRSGLSHACAHATTRCCVLISLSYLASGFGR